MLCPNAIPWMPNGVGELLYDDGTHGDAEAGDGVFTTTIDPGPQDATPDVDLGDNLKVIHAGWWDPNANGGQGA